MALEHAELVMPISDAGVGLPGEGFDGVGSAAFDVQDEAFALVGIEIFAVEDGLQLAVVKLHVGVVEVGGDL